MTVHAAADQDLFLVAVCRRFGAARRGYAEAVVQGGRCSQLWHVPRTRHRGRPPRRRRAAAAPAHVWRTPRGDVRPTPWGDVWAAPWSGVRAASWCRVRAPWGCVWSAPRRCVRSPAWRSLRVPAWPCVRATAGGGVWCWCAASALGAAARGRQARQAAAPALLRLSAPAFFSLSLYFPVHALVCSALCATMHVCTQGRGQCGRVCCERPALPKMGWGRPETESRSPPPETLEAPLHAPSAPSAA
jgi:hypothetical protein